MILLLFFSEHSVDLNNNVCKVKCAYRTISICGLSLNKVYFGQVMKSVFHSLITRPFNMIFVRPVLKMSVEGAAIHS